VVHPHDAGKLVAAGRDQHGAATPGADRLDRRVDGGGGVGHPVADRAELLDVRADRRPGEWVLAAVVAGVGDVGYLRMGVLLGQICLPQLGFRCGRRAVVHGQRSR
jgi:hypothetical protein